MNSMRTERRGNQGGWTLVEVAMVVAVLGLMGFVALPGWAQGTKLAAGTSCVDNGRRLSLAWQLYANENGGELVNNFGLSEMIGTVNAKTFLNWTHNVMDWSTNPSNTNRVHAEASKLFPYLNGGVPAFKCPADRFRSAQQTQAGWSSGRLRSYSMNGYMGPYSQTASDPTYRGENFLGPGYRQFVLESSIPYPDRAIVFLDEHPDSINDGWFINVPNQPQWYDMPGSYHNGGMGAGFADGHAEIHLWLYANTKQTVRYGFTSPGPIAANQRDDHKWLTDRMTVVHQTLVTERAGAGETTMSWSPHTSTYVLQRSASLIDPVWENVPEKAAKARGLLRVTRQAEGDGGYYRLRRP